MRARFLPSFIQSSSSIAGSLASKWISCIILDIALQKHNKIFWIQCIPVDITTSGGNVHCFAKQKLTLQASRSHFLLECPFCSTKNLPCIRDDLTSLDLTYKRVGLCSTLDITTLLCRISQWRI